MGKEPVANPDLPVAPEPIGPVEFFLDVWKAINPPLRRLRMLLGVANDLLVEKITANHDRLIAPGNAGIADLFIWCDI